MAHATVRGVKCIHMDGYLYILVNQYVPTLVKIGYTDRDPHVRAAELSGTTGVPGRWAVKRFWLLENAFQWEQRIFAALNKHRETGEFFRLSCDIAIGRIEALLLQEGAVDAAGISATGRRELARQEAARKREEQKILDKQQEQIAEQDEQRQFDNAWEQGWPSHVQPWCKLTSFCREQMTTYSRPGILHEMISGKYNPLEHLLSSVVGLPRARNPVDIDDVISHLRKWRGYPQLLALLPEMFAASRLAREFMCYLNNQYGQRTPSVRSEYWQQWHERPMPMLEIRLATQTVFGLSGDVATALLQTEPTMTSTLMAIATNSPAPESRYGQTPVAEKYNVGQDAQMGKQATDIKLNKQDAERCPDCGGCRTGGVCWSCGRPS